MIKTVLFDLGNVILPFDVFRLANGLSSYSSQNADEIVQNLWADGLGERFETGKLTPEAYFEEAKLACKLKNLDFQSFKSIFNDIFTQNEDVISIVKRLKKSYHLGLISNTNEIHANHVVSTYPIFGDFDKLLFSNDAGVRKPEKQIYQMALDHFQSAPEESIFIDDLIENIEGAHSLGMKGIHFKDAENLSEHLNHHGVQLT